MTGKWRTVALLAVAELLAMSVWFSASAVVPQLTAEWGLSGAQQSWLTMSVQVGFVTGALLSAILNLADRLPAQRLFAVCAVLAAGANAAIPLLNAGSGVAMGLRFLTGVALAGVYPPGMKLAASWCKEDRGLGIGLLVGALTLGSGVPHLLNALGSHGMPPWRSVLLTTSIQCLAAGLIAAVTIRPGPFLGKAPPFDWRFAGRAFADRLCLVWGFAVVADSAQFSAAISELADPRYVGTALTLQTSLGFLLTLFTIRMIPPLVERIGWKYAFMALALGPIFGIVSMTRLRRLPQAERMAGGRR